MSDPKWLSRREVERIYNKIIDATGGSHGLRDAGLLESALARPQNLHAYGENDVFQLAAAYAEGLAGNHAFVDGNKRIAYQVADIFLYENGQEILPSKGEEHSDMIEKLAQSKISREDAAQYFKDNSRTIQHEKKGRSE